MAIRSIEKSDLKELLALYSLLNPEDPAVAHDARLTATWEEILEDPNIHYFAVEENLLLIAAVMLAIIPNLTRGARPFGVVQNVIVHPEHRGRGIGISLMRAVNEFAWERDCYQILLQTGRTETHGFYERAGYRSDLKTGFVAKPPV